MISHPYPTTHGDALNHAYGGQLASPAWLAVPGQDRAPSWACWSKACRVKGVPLRFPGIRSIFCHGGGIMPSRLDRIVCFDGRDTVGADAIARTFPSGIRAIFAKCYFDCAQDFAS